MVPLSKNNKCTLYVSCAFLVLFASACFISNARAEGEEDFEEPTTTIQSPAFDEHFFDFIRPRLGHFSRNNNLLKIYQLYKTSVLEANDKVLKKIGINDWRNVRPTGELCVDFLTGFQVKDYSLAKPYDIIMLDACLDWLIDESAEREKTLDLHRFNEESKKDYNKLLEDPEFKKIYENTKFKGDEIPKELKTKLFEYFSILLKIFEENPRSGCNGLYLAAYDDFIEDVYLGDCEEDTNCEYFGKFAKFDGIEKDTYLNLIVDSTKQATKSCYGIVQKQMVERMHEAFENEPMQASIQRKFKKINSKAAKQSEEMKWGREMMRILQITSNLNDDDVVDLSAVVKVLKGIKDDDEDIKESFTSAVGAYAIKEIDPKDTAGDANGRARYGKAVMDLCKPYIDRKSFLVKTGGAHLWEDDPNSKRKPFEFFDMVYSLVRITNHISFYRTSKDKFENDVLKNGWEALYLATLSCHIISTTWGELSYDTNKPEFNVMLRKNYHNSIDDWPIEIMVQELPKRSVSSSPSVAAPSSSAARAARQNILRSRFNLFGNTKNPQEEPEVVEPASPTRQKFSLFGSKNSFKEDDIVAPTATPTKAKFNLFSNTSLRDQATPTYEPVAPIDTNSASAIPPRLKPIKRPSPIRKSKNQPEPEADVVVNGYPEEQERKASVEDKLPQKEKQTISLESIEMFKKLHGRYPQLSEEVKQKYAGDIPADLSGTYPKTLDIKEEPKKQSWREIDILSI